MSDPIIRVENLSKSYLVGHTSDHKEKYTALRDILSRTLKNFGRKTWDMARGRQIIQGDEVEEFWALRDVSFSVNRGDVVGIVGRNGAGKSTLLKVLSQITEPTHGRVTLHGRVASLLEVGTGFHPELTGRENVYLNGSVLGMTRAEISKKFDEIVSFAEVEKFLDTPVKRYSSGMYVRLAFAVAAHLEPEILVVDEVLAVGDAEFQKKCLGKMRDVSSNGRTILFVSHNMTAIQQLCDSAILLDDGMMRMQGDVDAVLLEYLKKGKQNAACQLSERRDREGTGRLRFEKVTFHSADGTEISGPISGCPATIRFHYSSEYLSGIMHSVDLAFNIRNRQSVVVGACGNIASGQPKLPVFDHGYFECSWPKTILRGEAYQCAIFCEIDGEIDDWLQDAFTIEVENGDFFGSGQLLPPGHGDVFFEHGWESCRKVTSRQKTRATAPC
jgi:lipopolysaccharide transport system ATP-binding protein